MKTKVKLNPVRILVPKYGNALMLLMEQSNKSRGFIIEIGNTKKYFEIELNCSKNLATSVTKNINCNLCPQTKKYNP